MARLRPGQLLILIGAALVATDPLSAAPAADPGPVFFREPDRETAKRIAEGIALIERASASDHERGRTLLTDVGHWAVEPLRAILRTGDSSQRRNAVLVLGTLLDRRALPDLLRTAENDPYLFATSFAALMAGKYQDPVAADRLTALLSDPKRSHRRRAAVLALTKVGDPRAFEAIALLVNPREDSLVRETAAFCLGFLRDQALVLGPDGRMRPCREIEYALGSSETALRRAGMLALALLGHRDLKDLYMRAAQNGREDHEVRRIALLALGRFPDEDVTKLLLGVVANPNAAKVEIEMAAMILKDRRDPAVVQALLRASPEDPRLKAVFTLALSNFESEEVMTRIADRLTDKSDQVRVAAAVALSRLTVPELKEKAIGRLTSMLQGKGGTLDANVRFDMERAREILLKGEAPGDFVWLGNEDTAEDLPKDVEERVLDLVNGAVERVLDLSSLTQIKAGPLRDERFRVSDEGADLRDLQDYLARYPYFLPRDIPEPRVVATPLPRPEGGR
ncbi:MAG: HEAT repeat domain-containing protein [Planctomycetes bacterium]|nr:HEAT repeat domain-containing protein [Planctomycetota bacterium]